MPTQTQRDPAAFAAGPRRPDPHPDDQDGEGKTRITPSLGPSPLGRVARAYASAGWHVFPCCSPDRCYWGSRCPGGRDLGKHPIPKGGLTAASADLGLVSEWWRRYPDANVGIRTGPESGVWVVDVDTEHDGEVALDRLEARHGILATLTCQTGGGGLHLFFAWPNTPHPIRNDASSKLGRGIDLRGQGGYVIAAPSLHRSGHRYQWVGPNRVAQPAPRWLLEKVLERPREAVRRPVVIPTNPQPGYWQKAVVREATRLDDTAFPGRARAELLKSAFRLGQLAHLGMTEVDEDGVVDQLANIAVAHASEPASLTKALRDSRAAFNAGKDNPRTPETRS